MAVRIGMHSRGLAQLSLLSALYWLDGTSGALAQVPDAGSAPAQPSAPAAPPFAAQPAQPAPQAPAQPGAPTAAPSAPAAASPAATQPAPTDPAAQPGSTPQQLVPPPPPPGSYVYPQQAPVYPQPYVAEPPGYYGNAPPPANYPYAQPHPAQGGEAVDEGYRRHDGFFLRLRIGIGAGGTRYEERVNDSEADIRTRGLAGSFELAIGGSLIENLALHGNLLLFGMSVNKKVDDVEDNSYDRLSTGMLLLGGGVTYYFMPTNLYLSAVTGVGALSESRYLDDDDETAFTEIESGAGVGFSLSLGKEWWVGRMGEWGLGAAITGTVVTAPVRIGELSTRFLGHSIALNFSATFN
jgi:hypothetical protein